jgi:hypothetical protein
MPAFGNVAIKRTDISERSWMKLQPFYIVSERFGPWAEGWAKYCEWAKIPNLEEVVSLDVMLCRRVVEFRTESPDEDWKHAIAVGDRLEFGDLEYILKGADPDASRNVLALYRNPSEPVGEVPSSRRFEFIGYDLVEDATQISALVNCGGFPESFSNQELNRFALIKIYNRAVEVQRLLIKNNPEESHADCSLYEIWRLV